MTPVLERCNINKFYWTFILKIIRTKKHQHMVWHIWTPQSFSPAPIPLYLSHHHRGGPGRMSGAGYWLCLGARWPESGWEAGRQTGAEETKTLSTPFNLQPPERKVETSVCLITCSSLSAAGRFLGFLVRAIFTNSWKFPVLQGQKHTDWRNQIHIKIWPVSCCVKSCYISRLLLRKMTPETERTDWWDKFEFVAVAVVCSDSLCRCRGFEATGV